MRIITCVLGSHDLVLVAIAAAFCCVGAWVTVRLYRKSRISGGRSRAAWVFLGAVAGGSTVWCTHFVAMLAYRPATPVSYELGLTALSLVVAIVTGGFGLAIGSVGSRFAPQVGGACFGAGIAAMHYTGMAAFAADGILIWDESYVVVSLLLAVGFSALAFRYAAGIKHQLHKVMAAGLLVCAIIALHFTGMAALTIIPSAATNGMLSSSDAMGVLAIAVAGVGLLVLGTGATGYLLDSEARGHAAARLRHLAESAVDGVVVEQDGLIVEANAAFAEMLGLPREALLSTPLRKYVDHEGAENALLRNSLHRTDGANIPVEVTARREAVRVSERAVVVYAIRDLRPRIEQERRIAYLARYDSLTGLPNRATFLEWQEQAAAALDDGESLALLAIDLDRFKEVNDLHGHAAGDEVLKVLADRMRAVLRPDEFLARLGGDEFVVLAPVRRREEALALAERLEKPLFSSISIGHAEVVCGGSIGIALMPQDADTPTTLMNNADLAMYRAKASVSQVACFYESSMDDMVRARRRMMKELREALQRDEFELHFQVQACVTTGEVTGYEALLRWHHPERDYVPPAEFIPLAEETGLILPIGEWVLRTACAEAAEWQTPHKVAVNLSAVQLTNADLPRLVQEALLNSGLPAKRLELEITETAMILDVDRTTHVLRQLKALGVLIAMDDFGTGYSSLSTLRAFPFDKIKLDRSFISELEGSAEARAIIRAVLTLGDSLGIPVLAEGVETPHQLSFLRELGCDEAQGYLLGRPDRNAVGTHAVIAA